MDHAAEAGLQAGREFVIVKECTHAGGVGVVQFDDAVHPLPQLRDVNIFCRLRAFKVVENIEDSNEITRDVCAGGHAFHHTGAIYRTKVQHNFAKWRRTSLAGFIVGSLAGEGPLLEAAEKIEMMKLAAASVGEGGGNSAILIGDVSQEGVHGALELARALRRPGARGDQPRAA